MEHGYQDIMQSFAGAILFGVFLVVLSHRLRVSAIVLLLIGGIFLGPFGINLIHPQALGSGLQVVISLAVALILFEGGLTLDTRAMREVPREIRRLLFLGVFITWGGGCLVVKLMFPHFPWSFALLAASLVIVTGPTVIGPLLKRTPVNRRVHNILHWEGVLIDPWGVFIALLCYKWIVSGGSTAIVEFAQRVVVGLFIGGLLGGLIAWVIKRQWIPRESLNIFVVASALGIFTLADVFAHESGLLAVTIAGFAIGYLDRAQLEHIKAYKAELTEMLIGLLFILLAANLDVSAFAGYGWPLIGAVLLMMFAVRPLDVFVSLHRSNMNVREKLFLSWVGPRGIVAASMASLFALMLSRHGGDYAAHAKFLEIFTYSVIAGTVIFQGFTARYVAKCLRILEPEPSGWLIVGAHRLGRMVASFIKKEGFAVVLVDTNAHNTALARRAGHDVICGDALTMDAEGHSQLYGVGNVLAISGNEDLNTLVCQRWAKELRQARCYKWMSPERLGDPETLPDLMAGIPIWQALNMASIQAIDAAEEKVEIYTQRLEAHEVRHPERILLSTDAGDGRVLPFQPPDATGAVHVLAFRPFRIQLGVQIKPEWIIFSEAETMNSATRELLEILAADYPECDVEEMHRKLMQQEEQYSSLIGYDVALPHTYTSLLESSVVLVAKLAKPLACRHTTEEIRYIFMVISPQDKPRKHLNALAEISSFITKQENLQQMAEANSPRDLVRLFFPDAEEADEDAPALPAMIG